MNDHVPMRRFVKFRPTAIAIVAFVALGCSLSAPALAVDAGQPAPAFALPRAGGEVLTLESLKGRVVFVDFWASWCAPCKRSFPWMNEMHRKYGDKGFTILAVNVDKRRADADRFLAQVPAAFPVVYDPEGKAPAAYGVKGMPSSYLIDARGNVVQVESGFNDDQAAAIEARIRDLVAAR
jgi:cytochrome c biogenesis protein CcmG, thiol:disulfide interchange protein DsbE